jgi:hypothetical protein
MGQAPRRSELSNAALVLSCAYVPPGNGPRYEPRPRQAKLPLTMPEHRCFERQVEGTCTRITSWSKLWFHRSIDMPRLRPAGPEWAPRRARLLLPHRRCRDPRPCLGPIPPGRSGGKCQHGSLTIRTAFATQPIRKTVNQAEESEAIGPMHSWVNVEKLHIQPDGFHQLEAV